jgi:menaquinone-specific isochorismate synthase
MTEMLTLAPARTSRAALVRDAIAAARRHGRRTLLTHAEPLREAPDALAFLASGSATLGGGVLWVQPQSGVTFVGAGAAATIRGDGPGHFGAVASAIREARSRLLRSMHDEAPFPWLGGFAFATNGEKSSLWQPFPDAKLVAPRVLLQVDSRDQ